MDAQFHSKTTLQKIGGDHRGQTKNATVHFLLKLSSQVDPYEKHINNIINIPNLNIKIKDMGKINVQ